MPPLTPETEDVLRRAAELRAAGSGWDAVARRMEWNAGELQDLTRAHDTTYRKFLRIARREVLDDGVAEAFCSLRVLVRSKDEDVARRAAEVMLKYKMTLVRHTRRSGKPKPDPRLEGIRPDDLEFARFLSLHTDEQLAAFAKHLNEPLARSSSTRAADGGDQVSRGCQPPVAATPAPGADTPGSPMHAACDVATPMPVASTRMSDPDPRPTTRGGTLAEPRSGRSRNPAHIPEPCSTLPDMLQPFFTVAMRAPARQLTFRRVVAFHVLLLTCLGWVAAQAQTPNTLAAVGQLALILGIVEGAALVGWRLTQLPKSQALEFLLVSPVQPRRVFFAEAIVGIGRFALVCLAGLPVLLAMVLCGAIQPLDLWPLALMPFAWGVVAALGLTAWAYEPVSVRRVGEFLGLLGVLVYLVVGILAGENLKLWLRRLPPETADAIYEVIMTLHHGNPFGVARNWFVIRDGPNVVWPWFVKVNLIALALVGLFGLRAAFRLKGHFHDRHYRPIDSGRVNQSAFIGEWPLSWWSVRRVMEYSGRVNVWLAGGFCLLYAAYLVAGNQWPAWMGRLVFQIFENWGGAPMVATAMCVLAAVPAAFQFGLWDPTATDRCRRLELLLLTNLNSRDYWHASLAAAWARGRAYLFIAAMLWVALAVSGRVTWYESLAAAFGGLALWAFSFAVGFRAFSSGNPAGGVASLLTLGLPLLLVVLLKAKLFALAAFVPTAACYLPLKTGITTSWADGLVVTLLATTWFTRQGLRHCERELRAWFNENQGQASGA